MSRSRPEDVDPIAAKAAVLEYCKRKGALAVGVADLEAIERIAPAGRCAWRGRVVRGEVQDENAWALGGVAGHAGLFATAGDVHRLTLEFVRAYAGRASRLDPAAVRKVWSGRFAADSTWALGWDTPTPGASSAGSRISNVCMPTP